MNTRTFEGTTRLQGIGMVKGITAKNLRVGDRRVYNGGSSSEILRIEASKTGKSFKVTTAWFDNMSKVVDGQWVGEWKEDTRTLKADTIVAVKELNPADAEAEVEIIVEDIPSQPVQPKKSITAFEKWIDTFIDEKGLELDEVLQGEHEGMLHMMSLEDLVGIIKKSQKVEQKQIKEKLVYIDFRNGDVMDFFKYLLGAYVKVNY